MYVCICVCTYVCAYVCAYACMYACMYAWMYAGCMYVCLYVCMYVCMYVYITDYTIIIPTEGFSARSQAGLSIQKYHYLRSKASPGPCRSSGPVRRAGEPERAGCRKESFPALKGSGQVHSTVSGRQSLESLPWKLQHGASSAGTIPPQRE